MAIKSYQLYQACFFSFHFHVTYLNLQYIEYFYSSSSVSLSISSFMEQILYIYIENHNLKLFLLTNP